MEKLEYEAPSELVELLDDVAVQALRRQHDTRSGETFVHCLLCGDWEGHEDDCPLPAILKWFGLGPFGQPLEPDK